MRFYKTHTNRSVLSVLLMFAFVMPYGKTFAHIFSHHEMHSECKSPNKLHFHDFDNNQCDFKTLKNYLPLNFVTQNFTLEIQEIFSKESYPLCFTIVKNITLSTTLRGPPVV